MSGKLHKLPLSKMPTSVFLYIPNIIGYVRVIFAFVSFYFMPNNPIVAGIFYILSQLMDALDGHAARRFNQCSSFGAVLDMVTDRISTLGLVMVLAVINSEMLFLFQCLAILDISSHWLQMYSSLLCGETSHKGSSNFFLNLYYTNKIVLFLMCAGNELFYVAMYLQVFFEVPAYTVFGHHKSLMVILTYVFFPIFFLKQLTNVIQIITASQRLAKYDTSRTLTSTSIN